MKKFLASLAIIGTLLFATNALASTYLETTDVGEILSTAQLLPGGIDAVTGTVTSDADLYRFYWGGGGFYANTIGSSFDSQLFLFDESGVGIWGNDDGISFAGPAYIQDTDLSAGFYYMGVSSWDYDPWSSAGLIFNTAPWDLLFGPNNLEPLSYWAGFFSGLGPYFINFQQVTASGEPIGDPNPTSDPVPEPATVLLLGSGLVGLAGLRRKLRKK